MAPRPFWKTAALALAFVLAQIFFAWIFSPKDLEPAPAYLKVVVPEGWDLIPTAHPGLNGYLRLNNWDSLHFFAIARDGYRIPKDRPVEIADLHDYHANITAWPAYPYIVRALWKGLGIPGELALLLTAQFFAWVFWVYLILILGGSGISARQEWALLLAAFAYPSSFYLVAGYTESMFMAGLLGLIYWQRYSSCSALHAALATTTRLAAAPVVIYPWLARNRDLRQRFLISAAAALGLASLFVICQFKFGDWRLYFKFGAIGWGRSTDPWAVFYPSNYFPHYFFEDTMSSINRTALPFCAGLLGVLLWRDREKSAHLGLYFLAFGLLYVAAAGQANAGMDGMIRYTLPVFALILILFAETSKNRRIPALGYCALLAVFLATQGWMAYRFLHGKWVT